MHQLEQQNALTSLPETSLGQDHLLFQIAQLIHEESYCELRDSTHVITLRLLEGNEYSTSERMEMLL